MGTEYTTTNFRKYYSSPELAKTAAEKNYKVWRKDGTIKWKRHGKDGFTSGDLAFVMYTISKVKVEE